MTDRSHRQVHLPMLLRGRILQMFAALERVGGTPIDTKTFHAFAFFTNVLSPVWGFEPLEGSVLKEEGAPYFPTLQHELDRLVGERFVVVHSLRLDDGIGLEATFRLDSERARPVLDALASLPDQAGVGDFLTELADAFAEIDVDRRDNAAAEDASYSDPAIPRGRVVDFGEWRSSTDDNPAWVAAEAFQDYMPKGVTLDRAEKINFYMQLMKKRAHG